MPSHRELHRYIQACWRHEVVKLLLYSLSNEVLETRADCVGGRLCKYTAGFRATECINWCDWRGGFICWCWRPSCATTKKQSRSSRKRFQWTPFERLFHFFPFSYLWFSLDWTSLPFVESPPFLIIKLLIFILFYVSLYFTYLCMLANECLSLLFCLKIIREPNSGGFLGLDLLQRHKLFTYSAKGSRQK